MKVIMVSLPAIIHCVRQGTIAVVVDYLAYRVEGKPTVIPRLCERFCVRLRDKALKADQGPTLRGGIYDRGKALGVTDSHGSLLAPDTKTQRRRLPEARLTAEPRFASAANPTPN